jgi:hypothetical protein
MSVLPLQKEFMLRERERAFSWDVCNEEELHSDNISMDKSNAARKYKKPVKIENPCNNNNNYLMHPMDIKNEMMSNNNKRDYSSFIKDEIITPKVTDVMTMTMLPSFLNVHPNCGVGEARIGAYTKEERQQVLERFRAKKQRRVWRKQIKYDCRKRLADTRPRVKGRFVSRKGDCLPGEGEVDVEDMDSECSGTVPDGDVTEMFDMDRISDSP